MSWGKQAMQLRHAVRRCGGSRSFAAPEAWRAARRPISFTARASGAPAGVLRRPKPAAWTEAGCGVPIHLARASAQAVDQFADMVIVTPACATRIKKLRQMKGQEGLRLRLSVEGGGCSGFSYSFNVEDAPPDPETDRVFAHDGAELVVDETSFEFVRGATVDFADDMMRSAFAVINNPNSENACGCGSSFALKNFESNPAVD